MTFKTRLIATSSRLKTRCYAFFEWLGLWVKFTFIIPGTNKRIKMGKKVFNAVYKQVLNGAGGYPGAADFVEWFVNEYDPNNAGNVQGLLSPQKKLIHEYATNDPLNRLIRWTDENQTDADIQLDIGRNIKTSPTIPAEAAGNLFVQIRMIAAIALMSGYDLNDDLTKLKVLLSLTGSTCIDISKCLGKFYKSHEAIEALENCTSKGLYKISRIANLFFIEELCKEGNTIGRLEPLYCKRHVCFDNKSVESVGNRAVDMFINKTIS